MGSSSTDRLFPPERGLEMMDVDLSRVIVTTGVTAHATQVHHSEFPEIRADGSTPKEAASQLLNHLDRALDSALTPWRRETMEHAIADVQAFVEQAE